MATLSITLPDAMKRLVEARVQSGLYADTSDYVRDLIRADLTGEGDWEVTDELAAAIEEGERSGISDRTFEEIVAEARAKFAAEG